MGLVSFITTFCLLIAASAAATSTRVYNHRHVGCFDLSYSIEQGYHHRISPVTLTECISYCKILNTRYVGVEASDNYCYCGGDIAEASIQRDASLCNIHCPDEPQSVCGGDWLMSLYEVEGAVVENVDEVDFLVGVSTGMRLYHSRSATASSILMNTSDWTYSVDYHYSKNLAFALTNKKLYKSKLDPTREVDDTSINKVFLMHVSSCHGFAVDWVQDRIYWANCTATETSIMVSGLNGEDQITVVEKPEMTGKQIKRMEMDPYKGKIFWTADGIIQSVDTSGEGFNPNVTQTEVMARALALDLRRRRVFYVGITGPGTSTLYSMDYTGGDETEHFSVVQIRSVYGLGILNGNVFWVNYLSRDAIYEAPLNLTDRHEVNMIREIDRAVWHMRLVHPYLQRQTRTDPCLDKGCVYSCDPSGTTSAKCKCPPGETLAVDGVSCQVLVNHDRDIDHRSSARGLISISILLVVSVVLVALLLVLVVDKYWGLLESKLFAVSYSRSRGRERGEESTEDDVNLV